MTMQKNGALTDSTEERQSKIQRTLNARANGSSFKVLTNTAWDGMPC